MKTVVLTENAQQPGVMPYSQAIKVNNTVYVAGQGPFDSITGGLVGSTLEEQTRKTFENLKAILEEAGADFDDVVKVTVILGHGADFDTFNEIYAEYFNKRFPARTIFGSDLGFYLQMDAIAVID
ncbi:2-iminobutanoate/2-iminopropanoate deaminase [Paenibacillus cellulosilyticus]|uniref:2-iminobutanoate/2-iminopropanoate deaminase n=1 Tax=Paenibacillus cellulosilyticus TaxID=375489 RepID=A0A2V2YWM8_9BACL|nr:Rid family detoxifying hydrolase [Paenibacillus cellulosilyticus]PWW03199.1 2-iminobutanoate/2-iminopropanoate deaminase [Paenibacillus cellulosilyticus]QKS43689.1 hypothetical protein HUB94_04010 [Paenibacillus cellulosilyticus]